MSIQIRKEESEPSVDAWIPPRGVSLLTALAKDVIDANGDGKKVVRALRKNLILSEGHEEHSEDRRRKTRVEPK